VLATDAKGNAKPQPKHTLYRPATLRLTQALIHLPPLVLFRHQLRLQHQRRALFRSLQIPQLLLLKLRVAIPRPCRLRHHLVGVLYHVALRPASTLLTRPTSSAPHTASYHHLLPTRTLLFLPPTLLLTTIIHQLLWPMWHRQSSTFLQLPVQALLWVASLRFNLLLQIARRCLMFETLILTLTLNVWNFAWWFTLTLTLISNLNFK